MIGDKWFITSVKKDSDAQKQGVTVGDQILLFGKFTPNRRDLWKMSYVIYKLDPANTLDLQIRKSDGTEKSSDNQCENDDRQGISSRAKRTKRKNTNMNLSNVRK